MCLSCILTSLEKKSKWVLTQGAWTNFQQSERSLTHVASAVVLRFMDIFLGSGIMKTDRGLLWGGLSTLEAILKVMENLGKYRSSLYRAFPIGLSSLTCVILEVWLWCTLCVRWSYHSTSDNSAIIKKKQKKFQKTSLDIKKKSQTNKSS